MIALILAAALQAVAPAPPAVPPAANEPPHDWSMLTAITMPPAAPDMVRFVRDEVAAGRCARAKPSDEQMVLVVPLAVRLGPDGIANSVVPLAIGCPTVEQYSAGVAQRMIRRLSRRTMMTGDRWYRTVITYTWPG